MCIFCAREPEGSWGMASWDNFRLTDAQLLEIEACPELPTRVPCTLLTGFLGSGKTTLLNRILTGAAGKYCVIQNEFGQTAVDDALVVTKFGEVAVLTMASGCMCCRVRGDLVSGLRQLVSELAGKHLDGVLIELSGLSEVGPVVSTFFADTYVQRSFRLDAIVTLLEAQAATERIQAALEPESAAETVEEDSDSWGSDSEEIEPAVGQLLIEQLSLADVVLINKCDLAGADERAVLDGLVRSLNPTSAVLQCEHGQVPLDSVLRVDAFSAERALQACRALASSRAGATHLHQRFGAISLERTAPMDELAFTDWLTEVMERHGGQLYRVKGICEFSRVEGRSLVQCVRGHAEVDRIDESLYPAPAGDGSSAHGSGREPGPRYHTTPSGICFPPTAEGRAAAEELGARRAATSNVCSYEDTVSTLVCIGEIDDIEDSLRAGFEQIPS